MCLRQIGRHILGIFLWMQIFFFAGPFRGAVVYTFLYALAPRGRHLLCIFMYKWIQGQHLLCFCLASAQMGRPLLCILCMRRASGGAAPTHSLRAWSPGQKYLCMFCGRNVLSFVCFLWGGVFYSFLRVFAHTGRLLLCMFWGCRAPGDKSFIHFFVPPTYRAAYSMHFVWLLSFV